MNTKLLVTLLLSGSLSAMTLEETVAKALAHNNTLKEIALEVQQSKENRAEKRAQNLGRFDLVANYDHYNKARTLAPLTPMDIAAPDGAYKTATTQDLITAGVAYNVVLFDGFAKQNSYKISDILYKNSLIRSKLGTEELIYNVRSLYLSLLALDEQLEAQQAYTESQKDLYEQIVAAYNLGSKSQLDTLRAKNAYIASRSTEDKLRANIAILRASIQELIGGEPFGNEKKVAITVAQEEEFSEQKIENLSRYKLSLLQSDIAHKKMKTASASYYPRIDFSAYYGYSMGPNATTNTSPLTNVTYLQEGDFQSENIWQLGLHLKWNLYDFGAKSARVQKEKLAYMQSKLKVEDTSLQLRKNLDVAMSKIKLAQADYSAAESQYELLDAITKAELVKYESNALTLTDLLDSRAKKELAYAKLISAKYTYQKAKYYRDYLLERGEKK